jgi:hypothetical protein
MKNVKDISSYKDVGTAFVLIQDERIQGIAEMKINGRTEKFSQTSIGKYSAEPDRINTDTINADKYNVAVNKNHAYLKYNIGDTIRIYLQGLQQSQIIESHDENCDCDDHAHVDIGYGMSYRINFIDLTVTELLDHEWTDGNQRIYFSDELYDELTKNEPINRVDIVLFNSALHREVQTALAKRFQGADYYIINYQESFELSEGYIAGRNILVTLIFIIVFFFVIVIISIKIADYVSTQKRNIYLLNIMGASHSDIYDSYMRLPKIFSLFSIIVSFTAGISIYLFMSINSINYLVVNCFTVLCQAVLAIIIFATYNYPMHLSMKKTIASIILGAHDVRP